MEDRYLHVLLPDCISSASPYSRGYPRKNVSLQEGRYANKRTFFFRDTRFLPTSNSTHSYLFLSYIILQLKNKVLQKNRFLKCFIDWLVEDFFPLMSSSNISLMWLADKKAATREVFLHLSLPKIWLDRCVTAWLWWW